MKATHALSLTTVPVSETTQLSLLIKFGADAPKDKADAPPRRALNLSLVLDRSGSMGGTPLRQAVKAAKALVDELSDKDTLSVVIFDDEIDTIVAPATVKDKAAVRAAIDKVRAGGTTNLCGGWEQGGKHVQAQFAQDRVNRVLLLTDGHANVGTTDTPSLVKLAQSKAAQGVATTTLGFGTSFNEDLLISMARAGEGNYYYIESHEDLGQVFQIELEGLSSVCAQGLTVALQPADAVEATSVLNLYRTEEAGRALTVHVGDVYAVEEKILALDLRVMPIALGTFPVATLRYTYRVLEGGVARDVAGELTITATAATREQAESVQPDVQVLAAALRQRVAKAKEQAVELSDKSQNKEAAKLLSDIAEQLRNSPVANQFEFAEELDLLQHFIERIEKNGLDGVLRKELRDQSYQAATRNRADLAQRGTAGGSASSLPTVTAPDGGISLRCEKVSGKLRIRVTADGFDPSKNVQFPRAIREEGVTYLVDQVIPSADGSYYRVSGKIRRLLLPGETVASKGTTRKSTSTKAAKVPATAADLPTCTEIGTGVLVQCVPEGKKLRARVVSDGYNPNWNIRFPRSIRELGVLYVCDEVVEASAGGSYVAQGEVKRLIQ